MLVKNTWQTFRRAKAAVNRTQSRRFARFDVRRLSAGGGGRYELARIPNGHALSPLAGLQENKPRTPCRCSAAIFDKERNTH